MALKYYSHIPGTVRVRLLESIVVQGEPHRVGEVLDVAGNDAMYLLGRHAAEPAGPDNVAAEIPVRAQVLADAQPPVAPPVVSPVMAPKSAVLTKKAAGEEQADEAEEETADKRAESKHSRARK